MLLALDTSLSSTGWALFDTKEMLYCGSVQTKVSMQQSKRFIYIAAAIQNAIPEVYIDTIVAEAPQIYARDKSKGDPNKLTPIWALAGYIIGQFDPEEFILIKPAQWKKNFKKTQMFAKILRCITEQELAIFNCDAFKKERAHDCMMTPSEKAKAGDTLDAIGIGLYHLGRLK